MSKSILKMQARELLGKEMKKVKGGRFAPGCSSCEQACSPGGYSRKEVDAPVL